MSHAVTDKCINCKYTDCVEVCPVDCFHEGPNMLVINPHVCIDCGVCINECPIGAIIPDTDTEVQKWIPLNKSLSQEWPTITQKKAALLEANEWSTKQNKLEFLEKNGFLVSKPSKETKEP